MRSIRAHIALPILLSLIGGLFQSSYGQNDFESVEELKEKAEELFEERKFVEAMPLYSQLLSQKPKDPVYNYKYGVSALYGQADKEKPLKHLQYAAKKKETPPPVHYYLGRTYHRNYRFGDAIKAYERFKENGDPGNLPVDRQLRMAKSGRSLMDSPNELMVLDKTRTGTEDFFRYYDPQGVKGRLILAPEDIRTEEDKKKGHKPLIFYPTDSRTIYYSSYGKDGDNGTDLYKVNQLPNGQWAKPQKLKGAVNTEFDEDHPFKLPQSNDLYFCSKGHNSMGGYDVFRSDFDPGSNSYGDPENLDFPINSPDDDLLYLADKENDIAYFASGRSSDADHLHVYKVRIKKIPMRTAILKGSFRNRIDSSEQKAKIIVKNAASNEKIGVFNSSANSGDYLITVPKSGKYKFLVRPASSEYEHKGTVEVPRLEEIRPLKQSLILKKEKGREKLVIKNQFDERFDNEDAILSQVMKQKGELDENDSKAMQEKLEEAKKANEQEKNADSAKAEEGQELIAEAEDEADALEEKAKTNEERSAKAFAKAKKEQQIAEKASAQVDSLLEEAKESDPEASEKAIERADSLQKVAKEKTQEAGTAYELGENLEQKAQGQRKAAEQARSYASELKKALDKGSKKEALQKVAEQKEAWAAARKKAKSERKAPSSMRKDVDKLEQKADRKLEEGQLAQQSSKELKERISFLDRRISEASGQKEEDLRKERKELRNELKRTRAKADSAFARADAVQEQADKKAARADLLSQMDDERQEFATSKPGDWSPSKKETLQKDLVKTRKENQEREEAELLADHRAKKEGHRSSDPSGRIQKGKDEEEARKEGGAENSYERTERSRDRNDGTGPSGSTEREDAEKFMLQKAQKPVRKEIQAADPSYEKEMQQIRQKRGSDPEERKEEIRRRKQELADKVGKSIEKKQREIRDIEAPQKRKNLEREVENLQKARKKLNKDLGQNVREQTTASSDEPSKGSKDKPERTSERDSYSFEEAEPNTREELKKLDPDYDEDIANIQNDQSLSPTEEQQRIREREKAFAEKIDKEIEQKERRLEDEDLGPDQQKELQKDIGSLEQVRSELESGTELAADNGGEDPTSRSETRSAEEGNSSKADRQGQSKKSSRSQEGSQSPLSSQLKRQEKSLLEEEAPDYDQDIQTIKNSDSSRVEKDLARARRTENLVKGLKERIAEEQEDLSNSNDPDEMRKSSEKLQRLRSVRDKKEKEAQRFRARATGEEPELAQKGRAQESDDTQVGDSRKGSEGKGETDNSRNNSGSEGQESKGTAQDESNARSDPKEIERGSKITSTVDPSYRSDMNAIENENAPGDPSYYSQKASREKEASERFAQAIDSTRTLLQRTVDTKEKRELTKKVEQLEKAKERSEERQQRFQAYGDEESDGTDPSRSIRSSYEADQKALEESSLPPRKTEKLKTDRRKEALTRIENAIRNEQDIRSKAGKGSIQKKAKDRISKLNDLKKELRSERADATDEASVSLEEEGKEKKEEARKRVNAILAETSGPARDTVSEEEGAQQELAADEARKAEDYAEKKRFEAINLRNKIEAEESSEAEKRRKRVQAMVLEEKADSAQQMAEAFKEISGEGADEDVDGEVIAANGSGGSDDRKTEEDRNERSDNEGDEAERDEGDDRNIGKEKEGTAARSREDTSGAGSREDEDAPGESGGSDRTEGETADGESSNKGTGSSPEEEETPLPKGKVLSPEVLSMEDTESIEESGDVFAETEGSPYSESNPIPTDPEMPEGVFYQVQVGAFQNSIPQDLFKGFAPLIGKTGDDGITRYRAGFFKDRGKAESAKEEIQQKGYPDAFVVAYEGGERIRISEAEARSRSTGAGTEGSGTEPSASSEPSSGSVDEIDGLFFTVQVGVYSQRLQSGGSLQEISPLYEKQTQNDNYRYSTGIFSSVKEARSKESRAKSEGIADAFITAYLDGERITIAKAQELIQEQGRNILHGQQERPPTDEEKEKSEKKPPPGKEEERSAPEKETESTPKEKEKPEGESRTSSENPESELTPEDIKIRVDLGTYKEQVPNDVAREILNSSGEGIKERNTEEGHTNFRTKTYPSFEAANQIRRKFVKKGVEKADIITLANGKKIPRERAIEVLKE